MGYRNIKPVMEHMDNLIKSCGLFNRDTELNGWYGCKSKSKEKSEIGKCYGFDCPLAYTADLKDMKEHDIDIYNEWKEDCENLNSDSPDDCGSEWVIQWREIA